MGREGSPLEEIVFFAPWAFNVARAGGRHCRQKMTEAVIGSAQVERLWRQHIVSVPKEGGEKHVARTKNLDINADELCS